jgi:uncharacterized membrane protein
MKNIQWLLPGLVLFAFAAGLYAYPQLPLEVASHWNAVGQVDDYLPKFWGVFTLPLFMIVVYVLFLIIPKIDPLGANFEAFRKYYDTFWLLTLAFLLYVHVLILAWNLGYYFNWTHFMLPALAVLWYFMGTFLEKTKRNWFIGIRTPWTLSSDIAWEKTHALGGRLFKFAAIFVLVGLFIPVDNVIAFVIIAPVVAIVLVTVVYSFAIYRQEMNSQ